MQDAKFYNCISDKPSASCFVQVYLRLLLYKHHLPNLLINNLFRARSDRFFTNNFLKQNQRIIRIYYIRRVIKCHRHDSRDDVVCSGKTQKKMKIFKKSFELKRSIKCQRCFQSIYFEIVDFKTYLAYTDSLKLVVYNFSHFMMHVWESNKLPISHKYITEMWTKSQETNVNWLRFTWRLRQTIIFIFILKHILIYI